MLGVTDENNIKKISKTRLGMKELRITPVESNRERCCIPQTILLLLTAILGPKIQCLLQVNEDLTLKALI